MLLPPVTTRVKQRRRFSGPGIDSCQVGAFAEIAPVASQGEIIGAFGPTVLSGNDVFDVVGQFAVLLAEQAVEVRCRRAFSFRMEMKSAALITYSARSSPLCQHD